jgi:hypothetical protein
MDLSDCGCAFLERHKTPCHTTFGRNQNESQLLQGNGSLDVEHLAGVQHIGRIPSAFEAAHKFHVGVGAEE